MRIRTWLVLPTACIALVACGDDSGGGDRAAISTAAKKFATEFETADCGRLVTPRLLQNMFGTTERCEAETDRSVEPSVDERVGKVEQDGDRATATITTKDTDSSFDTELLLRRVGDGWRVDDVEEGLIRGMVATVGARQFITGIRKERVTGIDGLLARTEQDLAGCLGTQVDALDQRDLRQTEYRVFIDFPEDALSSRINPALARCMPEVPAAARILRRVFEFNALEEVPEGQQRRCILKRIRDTIADRQFVALAVAEYEGREDPAGMRKLTQAPVEAARACS